MLSINIPVYSIEVDSLVLQLIEQANNLGVLFEIRVYDDCSKDAFKTKNRKISEYPNVVYLELENNLGRATIRNKMGFDSKFNLLLFIDADSKLINNNYLETFLNNARASVVLCGGTAYQKDKPEQPEKLLRWVYGKNREAVSAEIRNRKKGFIITSNNFVIEKSVFENIHFREDIKNYGHEDTLLGYDLQKSKVEVLHVNNPVEHTGLEDAKQFVQKTKMALENLFLIKNKLLQNESDFSEQVNFLNRYSEISKYIPTVFLQMFYKICHSGIEKHLLGKNPSLFWFDVYKLVYYSTLK